MKYWIRMFTALACALFAAHAWAQDAEDESEENAPPPETPLFGTHVFAPFTVVFEDNKDFTVTHVDTGDVARGRFVVFDNTILIADMAGPEACPTAIAGKYFWAIENGAPSFLMVRDLCDGRRDRFGAEVYVPPVEEDEDDEG